LLPCLLEHALEISEGSALGVKELFKFLLPCLLGLAFGISEFFRVSCCRWLSDRRCCLYFGQALFRVLDLTLQLGQALFRVLDLTLQFGQALFRVLDLTLQSR